MFVACGLWRVGLGFYKAALAKLTSTLRVAPASEREDIARDWSKHERKCEDVYLHAWETVSAARKAIGSHINLHNTRRAHSSHQARTPDVQYFASLPQPLAEAA